MGHKKPKYCKRTWRSSFSPFSPFVVFAFPFPLFFQPERKSQASFFSYFNFNSRSLLLSLKLTQIQLKGKQRDGTEFYLLTNLTTTEESVRNIPFSSSSSFSFLFCSLRFFSRILIIFVFLFQISFILFLFVLSSLILFICFLSFLIFFRTISQSRWIRRRWSY